ncbi:MAG TPA: CHAT domain-containing protein [bacterium]|nr:CHAT domain-containing protein [bacterium]
MLALPAGPDLLERWARDAGVPEGTAPLAALYLELMSHLPVAPGETLAAVQHVLAGGRSGIPAGEAGWLRHLEANVLTFVGRTNDSLPAYRAAFQAFRRAGDRLEAGRTTIGWTFACANGGDPIEATRVGRMGRRLLPRSEPVLTARLENNLGTAWHLAGHLERAAKHYRTAEKAFRRNGQDAMAGACRYNLGLVGTLTGEFRRARRDLEAARPLLARAGATVHGLYVETGLAELDLHEGNWDRGVRAIRSLQSRFREIGDERAGAWLHRELARLFTSLGAIAAALPEARSARHALRRLGIAPELANVTFFEGKLASAAGVAEDAVTRLAEARAHWERAGHHRAAHRARLEEARVLLERGETEAASRGIGKSLRYLGRVDRQGDGAIARAVLAECRLASGRPAVAVALARRAHADARRHPADLERPRIAALVARAEGRRGRGQEAVRWARRAVVEQERLLSRFGNRELRALVGGSRDPVYREAVDVVLEHGGSRGPRLAVDLLSRARSPLLVEDLLEARGRRMSAAARSAITRLRDELLAGSRESDDLRSRGLSRTMRSLEEQLDPDAVRARGVVRRAWERRASARWRPLLGDRQLVVFDRGRDEWCAFVVGARGAVRHVSLPHVDQVLRGAWARLRLTIETATRLPPRRRAEFLRRTHRDCTDAIEQLRAAIWEPLCVTAERVVVVPWGELHDVPLESLPDPSPGAAEVSRVPHPALLSPVSRRRRNGDALLLHGPAPGARAEVHDVARTLRRAGIRARTGSTRRALARSGDRLSVLHVAAHGAFHRDGWLLSGLELRDGWMGFEQLERRQLRGALLTFTSCESGQSRALPGSELDGWITAGLGSGATEMVLTLWKIDDATASEFSRAFYAHWASGRPAPAACAEARNELRRGGAHPFSWAAFLAVG